ncbi:pumilio homolog 2-like [Hibiscus syriacus]|uniref:pumilio homolog 2-like n=1 Tax=Hibiscus syriacus TaxID=106335 RepID=UPI001921C21D|nr:pumilio homolog 2-like [Hibiscus syriacus]
MLEASAEIGKKKRGNMKDDDELDKLLDEIPHATSHHHHHHHHVHQQHDNSHVNGPSSSFHGMCLMHDDDISGHNYKHNTCTSPVSGFSLQSDGSSSSLFSSNGSQTPPPLEDLKPHLSNGLFLDPSIRRKASSSDGLIGEIGRFRNLSEMYISNNQENGGSSFRDFSVESNGIRVNDHIDVENYGACDKLRRGFSDVAGILSSPVPMGVPLSFHGEMNMAFSGLSQQEYRMSNLLGLGMDCWNGETMRSPWQKKEPMFTYHMRGVSVSSLSSSLSKLSVNDALIYGQRNGQIWNEGRGELNFHGSPRLIQSTPQNVLPLSNGMARSHSTVKMPQGCHTVEDSYIIQGEGLNYVINKGSGYARAQNKGSLQEIGASKRQIGAACGITKNDKLYSPFSLPPKYNSLAEARGHIYLLAKDQHGCRFLQRLFDEGTRQDVQMIFKEIVDHVVELMMNPFGNYLIQKLLEVCNEEQRMQILLMVTEEPGQLVKISLNTHGTRVVQKLIETLSTRQQISLVISALEPGFLSLIKDLNGNHVVQRCLQCLSSEDNNFIFDAAATYCVEIATHQHGCCVLQRCISHSTGEYKKKLVEEISANGLLLAQDAYGNYVVQFILELKITSATSTLTSQFEGNYVQLSSQKFSSHVVEKCLVVLNDEGRTRIIRELLSATHFKRLLQDPHANYVVQTAVRVSEGLLHNSLVDAIESCKAVSLNSPYSKRIFSQKLLKR